MLRVDGSKKTRNTCGRIFDRRLHRRIVPIVAVESFIAFSDASITSTAYPPDVGIEQLAFSSVVVVCHTSFCHSTTTNDAGADEAVFLEWWIVRSNTARMRDVLR